MKIEISLFDAQLNAFFTIVKSFSWANAYAEKCNPQLNGFFTTWRRGGYGSLTKPQESGMVAWLNAPYMMTATDLTGLTGLSGLIALTGLAELHKNRLLVYQEPVLIAISKFETLAISCSSFSEQYQDHSGTELQLQRLKQCLRRRQCKEDLAS